jgi:hypothetical protein
MESGRETTASFTRDNEHDRADMKLSLKALLASSAISLGLPLSMKASA